MCNNSRKCVYYCSHVIFLKEIKVSERVKNLLKFTQKRLKAKVAELLLLHENWSPDSCLQDVGVICTQG